MLALRPTAVAFSRFATVGPSIHRAPLRLRATSPPIVHAAAATRIGAMSAWRGIATKRFTPEHEWISYDSDSNVGTVGITDYAQKSLGDVVYVELPGKDSEVNIGDQVGAVESVKAASDIFSPVSGIVEDVNTALDDQPGLLNKSPEEKGWLFKVRLTDPQQVESLLSKEAYDKVCEE